jgi:hypothetical protein
MSEQRKRDNQVMKKCDCCNKAMDKLYQVVHYPLLTYPNFAIKSEVCIVCKTKIEYLESIIYER